MGFVRDYVRILRSGVFMHSAYAARYLGSRLWLLVALLHFLWRGEAAGHLANPFIDPELRDPAGRRIGLAAFCRDARSAPASALFDPAWYGARHLPKHAPDHPFLHFWSKGFDEDLDPAPGFDLGFFKSVVAFYRPDKREFAFERMANGGADFPRSEAELIARQDAFVSDVAMSVLRRHPSGRRFLVYVQAAHDYHHPFDAPDRGFDVLLNIYDGAAPLDLERSEIVVAQNGTKTTAIRKLLAQDPELLTRYEAVLFLDDDIELGGAEIERLFAAFDSQGLDLAQPALTKASACAYAALKQPAAGAGVRPVSMVEIMMPLVSRRALRECGAAFSGSISGWGVDALLAKLVRERFGETIALIADVVAVHARDVDVEGGAFYRYLRRYGLEPAHEIALIATRHRTSARPDAVHFMDGAREADG